MGSFGAPVTDDLMAQVRAFNSNMTGMEDGRGQTLDYGVMYFDTSGRVYSGAYALGIPSGKTFTIKFKKAINADTQWEAPLNIQITYV